MKNILEQKATDDLNARLKFSLKFVKDQNIKNKKILDIGCGFGWFEFNVLKKNPKEICGIEISKSDLKAVREINDKRLSLKVGGALKIPFEDNYFDTVVAWEVIEHIPKGTEGKMFREVRRVLRENGVFYLSTPYDSILSKYIDPAWWLIGHRHYSKDKLIGLGEKNGFKVKQVYIKGGVWNLISILDMYISKWVFRRSTIFEKEINDKVGKEYAMKKDGYIGIFIKYEKTS